MENIVTCQVLNSSLNHIDIYILENNKPAWRLTGYYGFLEGERGHEACDFLRRLSSNDSLPWCIFLDFNNLLYSSDKSWKHPHPKCHLDEFCSEIEDCMLTELDLVGGLYLGEK